MAEPEGQKGQNGLLPEPPPTRPRRWRLAWLAGALAYVLLAAGLWLASYANTPSPVAQATTILIPRGVGVRGIGTILARQNLLANDVRFLLLATLTGSARQLRAGEYSIPPQASPLQILRLLERGNIIRQAVTIPEGLNVEQIAELLARDGWIDRQRFLLLTRDPEFIRNLHLDPPSLEGYLFPDTYQLTRGDETEKTILQMMTRRFQQVWQSITAGRKPALSRHQVVTLASIVEKETGSAAERPIIARVFLNRLARHMRLQADPTVIYGLDDFDGNLTRSHLRQKTPYNTYVIKGLPPGPICNPGREAMEAVVNPANTPYLYFVARNDGTHQFSKTLNEHCQAVEKFQKQKDEKE